MSNRDKKYRILVLFFKKICVVEKKAVTLRTFCYTNSKKNKIKY